jgi:peptidoglycan L-alanyl-D-glutamate endopeptidase CwlK
MTLRRLKNAEVTLQISAKAQQVLNGNRTKPFGSEIPFYIGETRYVGVIERHFHPFGGTLKPWGYHPGCSVFIDETSPAPVPKVAPKVFYLGKRSLERLEGVDERLVRVFRRAITITSIDFTIVEGLRSAARQRELFAKKMTDTLQSKHLVGRAVDVAPWVNGTISWDWDDFDILAPWIKAAAKEFEIPIVWGGNWPNVPGKSRRDGPHWQI